MQVETLKIFCDLIETKSFSKAASLNFLTQSAVSQQIKQLEEHFGKQLVERGVRTLSPTEAGELFYQGCKDVLQQFYELESKMMADSETVGGMVRISMIYSVGLHEFQPYLKKFLKMHPHVNVKVEYARPSKVYEDVTGNYADLGIVAYPKKKPGMEVIPFGTDPLVFICHPGHELAKKKTLKLSDLKGVPFIGFERNIPTRKTIDRVFKEHKVQLNVSMDFDNVETIKGVVEIDGGVSIVPKPSVMREVKAKSLKAKEFSDHRFERPLGILYRKGKTFNAAAERLVELLSSGKSALPEPKKRGGTKSAKTKKS